MVKTVYFDMDGVLADWVKGFTKLFPELPYSQYNAFSTKEQKVYRKVIDGEGDFYRDLHPFMPVVNALAELRTLGYQVEILSSVGKLFPERVIKQKEAWLAEYVEGEVVANFVHKSEHKARYATANTLLLDDRSKSVEPFLKAGGKAVIFHGDSVTEAQEVVGLVTKAFADELG